jgi:ribosomal protein S18 acetylase RimI-like enzyme
MKKRAEIQILPIKTSDIPEIATMATLADRWMNAQTRKSESFNTDIAADEIIFLRGAWQGQFQKSVGNKNDIFAMALKAVSKDNPRIILGSVFASSAESDYDGKTALIEGVAVHHQFWKQGIASRLLDESLNQLRERGAEKFELWAEFDNAQLSEFYKTQGWYRDNSQYKSLSINGRQSAIVRYERA